MSCAQAHIFATRSLAKVQSDLMPFRCFFTSELIFMMMSPMMVVTIEGHAIIRLPISFVELAISQHLTFSDGLQRIARVVVDNLDLYTAASFHHTYDRNFPTIATSTFTSCSPRSEPKSDS